LAAYAPGSPLDLAAFILLTMPDWMRKDKRAAGCLTAEFARPDLDAYLGKLYHNDSDLIAPFLPCQLRAEEMVQS
jgi:hypothetical protein